MYASTRTEELASAPWSRQQKDAFVRQQFDAQDRDYRARFPNATFSVVDQRGTPVGRLYVHRSSREYRLLDIALLPAHRGVGIGGQLIEALQREAADADVSLRLYVETTNRARRLYDRLRFVRVEAGPVYDLLEWRQPAAG